MAEPIRASVVVELSDADLEEDARIGILYKVGDELEKRHPVGAHGGINTAKYGRMVHVQVEDIRDDELADVLTLLNFRLVGSSTPTAETQAKTESADVPKMPTPKINENEWKWNMAECIDWVEAVVSLATDKTKAYGEAVQQLAKNIEITEEQMRKFSPYRIKASFYPAFQEEIRLREPQGLEAWKNKHGIAVLNREAQAAIKESF